MWEQLKKWARENDRSGRFIDNGEGNVVPATGGITSKMNRYLARQAAEALEMDMEDIRTMSCNDLAKLLKRNGIY